MLLALTVVVGDLLGGFLKDAFAAPRPCQAMFEELRALGGAVAERCGKAPNGMPSNHAINFFAAATFIALATPWRRWRIGLFACAVLVGLSRIYLGKHYPSQVLAGALVGALVGALGAWLASRYPTVFRAPVVDAAGPAFHSPAPHRESDESNRS